MSAAAPTATTSAQPGRAGIVLFLIGATLAYAFLTRLGLLFVIGAEAELSVLSGVGVFACGLLYDIAFASYLVGPAVLCLVLPQRQWAMRLTGIGLRLYVFAFLLALGCIALSEYIFFDEFGVRFNFIAVDYLVYTREVIDNIWQSYNVAGLMLANFVVAVIVYLSVGPQLNRLLAGRAKQRPMPRLAVSLWLAAAVFATLLGQAPRSMFVNHHASELASNGSYQLFAAFRNNEIEYEHFYARLPLKDLDRLLRAEVAEPHARFVSDTPLDIRREINNPGLPRRLNTVLIMVESLSAEFLAQFGDRRGFTPYLDALGDESLTFDNFYATGTRTVRGLEAVTLSMPPTPGRSIVKRIGRETGMWSLGQVLRGCRLRNLLRLWRTRLFRQYEYFFRWQWLRYYRPVECAGRRDRFRKRLGHVR